MAWKTSVSSQTYITNTTQHLTENSRVEWLEVPSKVAGSWINYPDGSRFRRATDYGRVSLKLTPSRSPEIRGKRFNGPIWHRKGTAGCYRMNNFSGGNWLYRFASSLGISSLIGTPSIPSEERNEAVTKSLNDIANQKANIGENLATLGQTIRMFKNPVQAYVAAIHSIYRNKSLRPFLRKSYSQLRREGVDRVIAGNYLQYVYGFAPLMQDIYGISELAKSAGKKPLFVNGSGTAVRMLESDGLFYSNASWDQDEYMQLGAECRTKCKLWAKLSAEYSVTRTLNQLGLLNPVSLVWDLVPFSFVIDWVLPIGPVLSALTAPAGLDFVDGSISRRVSAHGDFTVFPRGWANTTTLEGHPGGGAVAYEGYTRQRINSWPQPGLWFDSDPLRLRSDGSDRVFKALALAVLNLPRF